MGNGQEVFALDIGTRSVVGIVVRKEGKDFTILASEVLEHEKRAIYDGQIHDIDAVARSVTIIKSSLEKKLGYQLRKAAVAAAGRTLYTIKADAKKNVSPYVEITAQDIKSIETDALAASVKMVSEESGHKAFNEFYLVGYSVIKWWLDDQTIDNLQGQKGSSISVEVVATFLPRAVVESLISVLKRCDLQLSSITLEPIAASSVVVLPGMRKLNIALVDIGAGTSDVAISRDGSIFAYGMVPMAGDEITEKICEIYLLEFTDGERVKRQLSTKDKVTVDNVLGKTLDVQTSEILKSIEDTIFLLSSKIALRIMELNGKTPAAVLFVGGGSLMPNLSRFVAENLELPIERVGVKGRESLPMIKGENNLSGPFAVTPVGIAVNAFEGPKLSFIRVKVNDKQIILLGQEKPTVLKALLHSGFTSVEIFGRPGMALTFKLNGQITVVRGKMAQPAVVTVDGITVDLDTVVNDNNVIKFDPARHGEHAHAKIRDFISEKHIVKIYINDRQFQVDPSVQVNGKPGSLDDDIPDDAYVAIKPKQLILSDVFNIISFKPGNMSGKLVMKINGCDGNFSSPINSGDKVEVYWQNIPN